MIPYLFLQVRSVHQVGKIGKLPRFYLLFLDDLMNQAMLDDEGSSDESLGCVVPSGANSGDACQFVRSYLSHDELQLLGHRIAENPLLEPSQYEDRFTNPSLDCRDVCQTCLVTVPAYVTVRLAKKPSLEYPAIPRSGFEAAYLGVPEAEPVPSFSKCYTNLLFCSKTLLLADVLSNFSRIDGLSQTEHRVALSSDWQGS
jgi:hypothetical protein